MTTERRFKLELTPYESSTLLALVYKDREAPTLENENFLRSMQGVIDQLKEHARAIRAEAGVSVSAQARILTFIDKYGNKIIRAPYPWEDSYGNLKRGP